jgi:hypothetical protein
MSNDGTFLKSFDFPLRFDEKGDAARTTDEMSIEHGLRASVMIRLGGIPLATHLGSLVPLLPFDPNDPVTGATITEEIIRSTKIGEPRAVVDPGIVTSEDEYTARAIVPYTVPGRSNWSSLRLSIPLQNLDKG